MSGDEFRQRPSAMSTDFLESFIKMPPSLLCITLIASDKYTFLKNYLGFLQILSEYYLSDINHILKYLSKFPFSLG